MDADWKIWLKFRLKTQLLADGRAKILRAARLLALGSAVPILSNDVLSVVGGFLKYPVVELQDIPHTGPMIQLCSNDTISCRGLYRGRGRILVSPIKSPEAAPSLRLTAANHQNIQLVIAAGPKSQ